MLPPSIKSRLTLENDDKTFTPLDLLPVCIQHGIPLVYDVHHHRCLPDGLSITEASEMAIKTWNGREPLFHLSSPKETWSGKNPRSHHDFIDLTDFPLEWLEMKEMFTIDIEAKAKELAIKRLRGDLETL